MRTILGASLCLGLLALISVGAAEDRHIEYRAAGVWQVSVDSPPGTWRAILFKASAGDSLGGTITIEGATMVSDATLTGSMDARKVTFGVMSGGATVAVFSGEADGDELSGTFTYPALSQTGTWRGTLTEVAAPSR